MLLVINKKNLYFFSQYHSLPNRVGSVVETTVTYLCMRNFFFICFDLRWGFIWLDDFYQGTYFFSLNINISLTQILIYQQNSTGFFNLQSRTCVKSHYQHHCSKYSYSSASARSRVNFQVQQDESKS